MNFIKLDTPKKKYLEENKQKFYDFMREYKNETKRTTGPNDTSQHSLTYEPYGTYNIPDSIYDMFVELYTDMIVTGCPMHITAPLKNMKMYAFYILFTR